MQLQKRLHMQLQKRPVNSCKRDCKNRYGIEIGAPDFSQGSELFGMLMYKGFQICRKSASFAFS